MYDIFFFNANDKVMNIEPAILLMMHNLLRYPELSSNQLEFILSEMEKYEKIVGNDGRVRACVNYAFEHCQKVGVVKCVHRWMTLTFIGHMHRY